MTARNRYNQTNRAAVCSSACLCPQQNAALWLAVCLCVIVLRIIQ